jgi:DeoR family suf operon transcriptional repressor
MQATRRQILDTLKRSGRARVDQLAAAQSLSPVTIRHHLAILMDGGLVEAEKERRGPGRPHFLYRLTPAAQEASPKTYHLLADRLLHEIVARNDRKTAARMFRDMADQLMADRSAGLEGQPIEVRVDELTRVLEQEGFQPEWEGNGEEIVLKEMECPYYYVAKRHPEVCSLDLHLIRGMSGAGVSRTAYRISGDAICAYRILRPASL